MGISPQIYDLIEELKTAYSSLDIKLFSMEKLRRFCLALDEIEKQRILGYCPDLSSNKAVVDFSVVSDIIEYLEKNIRLETYEDNLFVPDFSQKISFNKLSQKVANLLNNAKYHTFQIDEFYNNNPERDKENLRNYLKCLYLEAISCIESSKTDAPDKVFFYILRKMSYNHKSKAVIDNAVIIMTFFFESCDIFEEPTEDANEQVNS
ncbi:MAG: hypothetical protein IJB93_01680 [Clostridia bacterium]|nr:hypothetical protein [Clostridia bacterium]